MYRAQGANLMGVEGDLEANYEALQREYNVLVEEIKRLQEGGAVAGGGEGVDFDGDEVGSASMKSMNALRTEYESKLTELKNEKRELVLTLSANSANLQRAEARAWQLQRDLKEADEEAMKMKLDIARMEVGRTPFSNTGDDYENSNPNKRQGSSKNGGAKSLLGELGVRGGEGGEGSVGGACEGGECKQS